VKKWPLVETAIDAKIEDQAEFRDRWDKHVSIRESPGRSVFESGQNTARSRKMQPRLTPVLPISRSRAGVST
jgi:hypothetical protein